MLRLIWPTGLLGRVADFKTDPWLVLDNPNWEVWHVPNAKTRHVTRCFSAVYSSNSYGMRDKERVTDKTVKRIAVLGDSFVEGYGVGDQETFTRILEDEIFKGSVEFLNFGTSGNFGTVQAWLLYRNLARNFQPDIVLLVFAPWNDVLDNSWWYWKIREPWRRRPYLVQSEAGDYKLYYPDKTRGVVKELYDAPFIRDAATVSYAVRFLRIVGYNILLDMKLANAPNTSDIYKEHADEQWSESWKVTERALISLRDEVQKSEGELVVIVLPDPSQIHTKEAANINANKGYDVSVPNKKIEAILRGIGVKYWFLYPSFSKIRDEASLSEPYFSFDCDNHWSPYGHRVAAKVIAEHLF